MGGQPSEITLVGEKESFFVSNAVSRWDSKLAGFRVCVVS